MLVYIMKKDEIVQSFLFHIGNTFIAELFKKFFVEHNDYYSGSPTDFMVKFLFL